MEGTVPSSICLNVIDLQTDLLSLVEDCTRDDCSDNNNGCNVECADVKLTLTTDNYPYETSFHLRNIETNTIVWNGAGFLHGVLETTTYTSKACPTNCYEFLIKDSYEDGICCEYGDGGYELFFKGEVVSSGGAFNAS